MIRQRNQAFYFPKYIKKKYFGMSQLGVNSNSSSIKTQFLIYVNLDWCVLNSKSNEYFK